MEHFFNINVLGNVELCPEEETGSEKLNRANVDKIYIICNNKV